ncbi:hypothetical protein [Streptomyces sp. NPDC052701]|uniref:hypothetical protein n=1 Tax=Streptomyces sp. NPDC052701 TaxID=3155533 RepID=UPI0034492EBC
MLALLRRAYPYLPADAEGDGPGAGPSAMVTAARAVRRAAQLGRRAAYSGPDSMEVYNDLVVGKYSWVPDDDHPGPAAAEMENLPVHWLNDWMLCLDVECAMRDETVLHRLYGTVTSYEPGTGRVGVLPHRRPPGHLGARPPDRRAHRRPAAAHRRTGASPRALRRVEGRPRGGSLLRGGGRDDRRRPPAVFGEAIAVSGEVVATGSAPAGSKWRARIPSRTATGPIWSTRSSPTPGRAEGWFVGGLSAGAPCGRGLARTSSVHLPVPPMAFCAARERCTRDAGQRGIRPDCYRGMRLAPS